MFCMEFKKRFSPHHHLYFLILTVCLLQNLIYLPLTEFFLFDLLISLKHFFMFCLSGLRKRVNFNYQPTKCFPINKIYVSNIPKVCLVRCRK